MKVVLFEAEPREAPIFERLKQHHDFRFVEEPLRHDNAGRYAEAEVVSTFIYSQLDRQVLEKLPALRLIATRSTGYDHIDMGFCAERGIAVANVPSYGENTVAEHVFALLLAISHRLPEAIDRAQRGHFSPEGLQGFDLAGKTLGVIGTGRIGQHVIRIARGFQMEVLAHDVHPAPGLTAELGFRYVDLDALYAAADILTLHVPSLPATRHMISAAAFQRMKDGVVADQYGPRRPDRDPLAHPGADQRQGRGGRARRPARRAADPRGGGADLLDLVRPARPQEPRCRPRSPAHAQRHRNAAQRLQHARGGGADRRDDGREHPGVRARKTAEHRGGPRRRPLRQVLGRARHPKRRTNSMAEQSTRTRRRGVL